MGNGGHGEVEGLHKLWRLSEDEEVGVHHLEGKEQSGTGVSMCHGLVWVKEVPGQI